MPFRHFSSHHMEQEGAASSAPDEASGESGADAALSPLDVASGIALVEPGVEQTIVENS